MDEKIFDISFIHEGRKYTGWVTPSDKLNEKGTPSSFHVVLNDTSFGHLSFQNCIWTVTEERPVGLVRAVGKQIEKHFQL